MAERLSERSIALLESQRATALARFVSAVVEHPSVSKILEVRKTDVIGDHFVFVITDGYNSLSDVSVHVGEVLGKIGRDSLFACLLGATPIFPDIGFFEDFVKGVRGDKDPNRISSEIWNRKAA